MNLFKVNRLKCILTLSLFPVIFGCTSTKTFPPNLNSKADTVIAKLKSVSSFDDINLQEKTTSGSKNYTILTIRVFNGKNLPAASDTVAEKKLGKDIASQIKPILTDAGSINSYVVLFCTRVIDGNVTHTSYFGYEYKPEELQ